MIRVLAVLILLPELALRTFGQSHGIAEPDLLKEAFARAPLSLDSFNGLALNANPTLRQAEALVRRSAGQARQAGIWPNPTVGYQGEQIRGGDYGGGEQGAFVQQTVVLGGKLGLRSRVYDEQRAADEIAVAEQRSRVLSDVGQRFFETLAAQETVKLRKQLLGVATDAVETAHQLENVGQADAPDVLQSEVEAEQAKVDYAMAQRAYLKEFRVLAAAAGETDLPVAPLEGNLMHPPQLDAEHVADQMVRDSPVIKRAQREAARAEASLRAAKREKIPDLAVRVGMEQNFEHLGAASSRVVGAQGFATIGVNVPIFNRNQGNVAAGEAEVERARNEVTRAKLRLRQETQVLLQTYLANQMQAARYQKEMIPRAERAYQLYLEKYRSMAAAYPQVLVSQRTLFQLRVVYIQVLQELWTESVALQNYTLSDGLRETVSGGTNSTELNLPSAYGVGVQ